MHNNKSDIITRKRYTKIRLKIAINQTYPGYFIYKLVYVLLNDTIN